MWVGTHAGLSRFDHSSGKFFTYGPGPGDPASLEETNVQSIGLDADTGMLWIGTEDERRESAGSLNRPLYTHMPTTPISFQA